MKTLFLIFLCFVSVLARAQSKTWGGNSSVLWPNQAPTSLLIDTGINTLTVNNINASPAIIARFQNHGTDKVVISQDGSITTITQPAGTSNTVAASTAFVEREIGSSNTNIDLDLFALAGQSNAVGFGGTNSLAPTPITGILQWTSTNGIEQLALTYNANNGENFGNTIVPAFGNTYNTLTGRRVAFVMGGDVGGTTQVASGDTGVGNWDTTGTLRTNLVFRYKAAQTAFVAAGYRVHLKGILWIQGDSDAVGILNAVETAAQYYTQYNVMAAYYRANLIANLPIYFVRIGINTNNPNDSYNLAIRQQQENITRNDPLSPICYWDTFNFTRLGWLKDHAHYTQPGLNDIGIKSAIYIASTPIPQANPAAGLVASVAVTADNQVINVNDSGIIRLTPDNATPANRSIVLSPPLRLGHQLTIENASVGLGVQLLNNQLNSDGFAKAILSGNWDSSSQGDTITLVADGANWLEIGRQSPAGSGGLPTQTGNNGKFLTTDGTSTSWATVSGGGGGTGSSVLAISIADKTVSNTTNETSVIGTLAGSGSLTTAANYFSVGTVLDEKWQGYFSANVADTLTIKIKAGSTVVGSTGPITLGALTNKVGRLYAIITCRTTGASGTFIVNTLFETAGSALAPQDAQLLNTSTVTLDTTGTLDWDVTATWGTASATDTITGSGFKLSSDGSSQAVYTAVISSDVTTTSTSATSSGLTISNLPIGTYEVHAVLNSGCSGAGGVKYTFATPASSTYGIWVFGENTSATAYTRGACATDGTLTSAFLISVAGPIYFDGKITTTASGTFDLKFASTTSGQTSTITAAYSTLKLTKIL